MQCTTSQELLRQTQISKEEFSAVLRLRGVAIAEVVPGNSFSDSMAVSRHIHPAQEPKGPCSLSRAARPWLHLQYQSPSEKSLFSANENKALCCLTARGTSRYQGPIRAGSRAGRQQGAGAGKQTALPASAVRETARCRGVRTITFLARFLSSFRNSCTVSLAGSFWRAAKAQPAECFLCSSLKKKKKHKNNVQQVRKGARSLPRPGPAPPLTAGRRRAPSPPAPWGRRSTAPRRGCSR